MTQVIGQKILSVPVLLILFFSLFGCDKADESKPIEPATPGAMAGLVVSPKKSEFRAVLETLAQANQYQVRLNWELDLKPKTWTIDRYEASNRTNPIKLAGQATQYVDKSVKPGETYTYVLLSPTDSSAGLRVEVKIPKDLEVVTEITLDGALEFNRIFFRKGSKVKVGKSLILSASELSSDGAVIEAGLNGAIAAVDAPGVSSPSVKITANVAMGQLEIKAHGSNGGVGSDGVNGGEGTQGALGSPAKVGFKYDEFLGISHNLGGHWACITQPGDGAKGGIGGNATNGQDGKNGGDSGTVIVNILSESPFSVDVDSNPGKGGIAGRGGGGGPGGPGGAPRAPGGPGAPPGARGEPLVCNAANSGPRGDTGKSGLAGNPGSDGKRKPVCVRIGSQLTGDCNLIKNELELR
jgi:hypothetical protein